MKYLIITFFSLIVLTSCKEERNNLERVQKIGNDLLLLDFANKDDLKNLEIVSLGNSLIQEIEAIKKQSKTITITIEDGDFDKPFGNNQADYIMKIKSGFKNIGVRLKYNSVKDKFDILGWKTL
jgi:hypothetical protein